MTTKSIPELLKRSLQSHMAEADLREDEELQDIMEKLSSHEGITSVRKIVF